MNPKNKKRIGLFFISGLIALGLASCGRCPWHHGDRSQFLLRHLDSRMEKLDLNDSQKASYQSLRAGLEADLKKLQGERKDTTGKIKAELSAASPDMKKVAGYMKEGMKRHPDVFERNIDRLVDFYGQLNEKQQKDVRELILKRIERFDS